MTLESDNEKSEERSIQQHKMKLNREVLPPVNQHFKEFLYLPLHQMPYHSNYNYEQPPDLMFSDSYRRQFFPVPGSSYRRSYELKEGVFINRKMVHPGLKFYIRDSLLPPQAKGKMAASSFLTSPTPSAATSSSTTAAVVHPETVIMPTPSPSPPPVNQTVHHQHHPYYTETRAQKRFKPSNALILDRKDHQHQIQSQLLQQLKEQDLMNNIVNKSQLKNASNLKVSKILGEKWQQESEQGKQKYFERSTLNQKHY